MNILGMAPMSGVLRAATVECADMARCTIRKFVHQYPNDRTNPSPAKMLYHSTPIGFAAAVPVYFQVVVQVSAAYPFPVTIGAS